MSSEILQVIRCSGNVVSDVIACFHVPEDQNSPERKKKVAEAEEMFKQTLNTNGCYDADELEDCIENGYGEESDGDTICLVWSTPT